MNSKTPKGCGPYVAGKETLADDLFSDGVGMMNRMRPSQTGGRVLYMQVLRADRVALLEHWESSRYESFKTYHYRRIRSNISVIRKRSRLTLNVTSSKQFTTTGEWTWLGSA